MDKETDFPTEEEQYEAYKAVLEGMNNKPIVIRTLDIGGDKKLDYSTNGERNESILRIQSYKTLFR